MELAYYLGGSEVKSALTAIAGDDGVGIAARKLSIKKAVGLLDTPEEIEVLGSIIVLRTEGEAFCGTARRNRSRLKNLGLRVYQRFLEVADLLAPVYGAILIEYSLETPDQLRSDSRSLAFQDFFLGIPHFTDNVMREVIHLAGNTTYVEHRPAGVYVSMSAELNPKGRGIEPLEAQERSARIAAVLGRSPDL